MYGIELDEISENGSNGTINDKQYFECKPGHRHFAKLDELSMKMKKLNSKTNSNWIMNPCPLAIQNWLDKMLRNGDHL